MDENACFEVSFFTQLNTVYAFSKLSLSFIGQIDPLPRLLRQRRTAATAPALALRPAIAIKQPPGIPPGGSSHRLRFTTNVSLVARSPCTVCNHDGAAATIPYHSRERQGFLRPVHRVRQQLHHGTRIRFIHSNRLIFHSASQNPGQQGALHATTRDRHTRALCTMRHDNTHEAFKASMSWQ